MRRIAAVAALLLAACSGSLTEPAAQELLNSSGRAEWNLRFSPGATLTTSSGGWVAEIPVYSASHPDSLNMVTTHTGALTPGGSIYAEFAYETDGDAELIAPGDSPPAMVHLYLEGCLANWSATDPWRWWTLGIPLEAGRGSAVLTAPLDWRSWGGIVGQRDEKQFNATLAGACSVGLTFSGRTFGGHGVARTSASSPARVRLVRWEVR